MVNTVVEGVMEMAACLHNERATYSIKAGCH
jgi:hypothetical protein